jgi:uncharacterized protein (DUF1501 family)
MNEPFAHFTTRRRDFLRQAACAAVGALSARATIRDLWLINSGAGQETFTDYKAMICIFLAGGNDSNNLIIPVGSEYANYAAIRQNLALPQGAVLPLTSLNPDGHQYALHPTCPELKTLFAEQKLAFLFNTGPLVQPLNRSQYQKGSVAKPPQLFSHSDQVTHWQTAIPDQTPLTGWGGRIADLLHPCQYQLLDGVPTANSAKVSLCTSLAGANTFEVGNSFAQFHVSTSGAVTLGGVTGNRLQAVKDILSLQSANLQRNAYAEVTKRAIDIGDTLNTAIAPYLDRTDVSYTNQNNSAPWSWQTGFTGIYNNGQAGGFPNTGLGKQMKMIARLIAGRSPLSMKRQIFYAQIGGYDTHTAQVGTGAAPADTTLGSHANLLNELSEAIYAFQRAMEQLGLSDKVTSFTASDFGRTFPTNGQGSDHGWGGHHLIVGGAVRGGRTFGTFPTLAVNGPDDTSTGRWIPTVSVDEYSATLARWFGVSQSNMATVFPNLGRFANPDLGFMMPSVS